jgi:hypothetical protein
MAITYAVHVKGLEKKDISSLQSVVVKIHWVLTGTGENGISADFTGWTDIPYDESTPFVAFDQLTESQVLGWIPQSNIENAKPVVADRIAILSNTSTLVESADLPWNKAAS